MQMSVSKNSGNSSGDFSADLGIQNGPGGEGTLNFVAVAIVEEYAKMRAAKPAVWKSQEFNYHFNANVSHRAWDL